MVNDLKDAQIRKLKKQLDIPPLESKLNIILTLTAGQFLAVIVLIWTVVNELITKL